MNKLICIFLICFLSLGAKGQFINQPTTGSNTTLNRFLGGIQGDSMVAIPRIIYTDTLVANYTKAAKYQGSLIMTGTAGNIILWIRNLNPNRWVQIATNTGSGFVPYVGATQDIYLDLFGINGAYAFFSTNDIGNVGSFENFNPNGYGVNINAGTRRARPSLFITGIDDLDSVANFNPIDIAFYKPINISGGNSISIINYATNLSSLYTTRTLVDKGYVDSSIVSSETFQRWFLPNVVDSSAVGDSVTNNTIIVNGMLNRNQSIYLPTGAYLVDSLENLLGIPLWGPGVVVENKTYTATVYKEQVSSYSDEYKPIFGQEYLSHFHNKLLNRSVTDTVKVSISGNSVVEGGTVTQNLSDYTTWLNFQNFIYLNEGHSGQSTSQWLSTYLDEDLAQNPDVYIIWWGINDAPLGVTHFLQNMENGLRRIRAVKDISQMTVIIMTPSSTYDLPAGRDSKFYEKASPGLASLARKYGCGFIDIYGTFPDSKNGVVGNYMDNPYGDGRTVHPLPVLEQDMSSQLANFMFTTSIIQKRSYTTYKNVNGAVFVLSTETPSFFQSGASAYRVTNTSLYPLDGAVIINRHADGMIIQTNIGYQSDTAVWQRTGKLSGDTWNPWYRIGASQNIINGVTNASPSEDAVSDSLRIRVPYSGAIAPLDMGNNAIITNGNITSTNYVIGQQLRVRSGSNDFWDLSSSTGVLTFSHNNGTSFSNGPTFTRGGTVTAMTIVKTGSNDNELLAGAGGVVTAGSGITISGGVISAPNAGVSSISGTSNQITASASTGAVSLSIPSTFIAPGTVTVTGNTTLTNGILGVPTDTLFFRPNGVASSTGQNYVTPDGDYVVPGQSTGQVHVYSNFAEGKPGIQITNGSGLNIDLNGNTGSLSAPGTITFANLAGTGSRAVLADASGVLSAPVSDSSIKIFIKTVSTLSKLMQLNPVTFYFDSAHINYGSRKQYGYIAQQVERIFPEIVFTTSKTGLKGINYGTGQWEAILGKAIQELKQEKDAEISELKNEISILKQQVSQLLQK